MSMENATADTDYEDWVATLDLVRRHWTSGSTVCALNLKRWIRSAEIDADSDVTMLTLAVDFEFRQYPARDQEKSMFLQLVEQWRAERAEAMSSMAEIIACPSYLRIIGMGWRALPLIIEQLESEGDEPDHWCAALEAVTGEDPVPEDAHGDTVRIAQAWIAWNKARIAWSFPTSTTQTIESPATGLVGTTALLGPQNLM